MDALDDFSVEQDRITRQQAIAQALLQRGGLLPGVKGERMMEQADKDRNALAQRYQSGLAAEVARIAALRQGREAIPAPADDLGGGPAAPAQAADPRAAIQAAMLSQYAPVRRVGDVEYGHLKKSDEPYTLKPGEIRKTPGQPDVANENPPASDALRRELAAQADATRRDLAAQADATRRELAPRTERPSPGYRFKPDGSMEPIPGGPADTKVQGALNMDTQVLNNTQADLDRLAAEANRLLKHPGLEKATGAMSMMPLIGGLATVPGTDAANFKAGLETLKSQVGFGVLQNMRNNSKTGGALGQVSDRENKLLQENLAALDRAQSVDEFKAALGRIIKYTDASKDRLREAYNMKHGERRDGALKPTSAPTKPRVVDW